MGLRSEAIEINDNLWYYEERKGIIVVHRVRDEHTKEYLQTDQFVIPWKKLLESVGRKYGVLAPPIIFVRNVGVSNGFRTISQRDGG